MGISLLCQKQLNEQELLQCTLYIYIFIKQNIVKKIKLRFIDLTL